jgi:site-specific DNA-methyltransferase (adenine-specific)
MPEQLLGRIIRASSHAGDTVLDPFTGSGTTLAVAKKLGRSFVGCELSEAYAARVSDRLAAISSGDPLDGAAEPLKSAPATKDGRKLGAKRQPKGAKQQKKRPKAARPGQVWLLD